ncbi:hypothetical protein [Streptomyces agglomeratus]|uniref:hypothetical protein n=1 Tax=Streptomyces agglomeratus TaxID=285458 RepID=UPI0009A07ED5|nr:hypothetical protein [Streptomyces agglomeratus]
MLTEVLAPLPVGAALLVSVGWHSTWPGVSGAVWGSLLTVLVAGVPLAWVFHHVRQGRFTDWQVVERHRRIRPLLLVGCCFVAAWGVLLVGEGPAVLGTVLAALTTSLIVTVCVTRFWKISVHTTVCSLAVTTLTCVGGTGALWLTPLVGLVGWTRVRLNLHTLAQTVAGAALGASCATAIFLATARPV